MIYQTINDMEQRLREKALSIIEDMLFGEAAPEDLCWILYLINNGVDWFCNLCAEIRSVSPDMALCAHGAPIPTQREVVEPSIASPFIQSMSPICCDGE